MFVSFVEFVLFFPYSFRSNFRFCRLFCTFIIKTFYESENKEWIRKDDKHTHPAFVR